VNSQNIRPIGIFVAVALLLLIPLTAMRFTDEVKWNWFDFVVAGSLLLGIGLFCELVLRKVKMLPYRIALCFAILFAFLVIWAELAVGIIGTPLAGS
jgi:hypothetical protein